MEGRLSSLPATDVADHASPEDEIDFHAKQLLEEMSPHDAQASFLRNLPPHGESTKRRATGTAHSYLPVNRGVLFSTKCATPSLKSSVPRQIATSRLASCVASANVWRGASTSCCLTMRMDRGEQRLANSDAFCCTASPKFSAGSMRT